MYTVKQLLIIYSITKENNAQLVDMRRILKIEIFAL